MGVQLWAPSLVFCSFAVLCAIQGIMAYPSNERHKVLTRDHVVLPNRMYPIDIHVQKDAEMEYLSVVKRDGDYTDNASHTDLRISNRISQSPMIYVVGVLGTMAFVSAVIGVIVASVNQKKTKSNVNWLCELNCFKTLSCTRPSREEAIVKFTSENYGKSQYIELFPLMPSGENGLKYELATAAVDEDIERTNEKCANTNIKRADSGFSDYSFGDDESVNHHSSRARTDLQTKLMWKEMKGQFNHEGGLLESMDSDVKLILPEGALQGDQLTEIYVKVFVDVRAFSSPDEESFFVTPIVECGPPGLQFLKPVQIILPHRVKIGGPSKKIVSKIDSNMFNAVYSNDVIDLSTNPPYEHISFIPAPHVTETTSDQSVTFDVDEKFVNINTTHFTLFGCVGPKRKHQLQLKTYTYYNSQVDHGKNRLIVQFRLYISSPERDRRTSVEKTEKTFGGQLCTPEKPFHLLDRHDVYMEIYLEDAEQWTIRKPQEYIANDEFYEDSSSCFQLTVTRPLKADKDETISSCMMGEFRLVQRSSGKKARKTEHTYSQILELTRVTLPSLGMAEKTPRENGIAKDVNDTAVITDKILDYISSQLSPREMRKLARSLGLSDVTIDQVEHDYTGAQEQAYQTLRKWKMAKSSEATFEELVKALEDCGCCNVAEMLYKES